LALLQPSDLFCNPEPLLQSTCAPLEVPIPAAGKMVELEVIGAGDHGVEEMQELLDDRAVQWALLRFDLGSGATCRRKVVFLHMNGEDCPPLLRGRSNALTADAQNFLRKGGNETFHASLEVKRKSEVTTEQILSRVERFFTTDDLNYTVKLMLSDCQVQLARGSSGDNLDGRLGLDAGRAVRLPGHQSSNLYSNGRDALKAVAEPLGPWNWVLMKPDPVQFQLVAGGAGSVDEMCEHLSNHSTDVLFGLLRMGFGVARLRRTKHVFIHFVGPNAGPVPRGRAATVRSAMEKEMAKLAAFSISLELSSAQDLTLEAVIGRMRKSSVIDDDVLDGDKPEKNVYSCEAFREALREERQIIRPPEEVHEHNARRAKFRDLAAEEVVGLVHTLHGPLNWALFGPSAEAISKRQSLPVLHGNQTIPAFLRKTAPAALLKQSS